MSKENEKKVEVLVGSYGLSDGGKITIERSPYYSAIIKYENGGFETRHYFNEKGYDGHDSKCGGSMKSSVLLDKVKKNTSRKIGE